MDYVNQMTTMYQTGEETGEEQSFEDYMAEQHMLENPHLVKDELIDHFNDWLSNLDKSDVLKFARDWGARCPEVVADDYWKKEIGTN